MKPLSTLLFAALTGYVHIATAEKDASYYACYSNSGSLTKQATDDFNSRGACRTVCVAGVGYSVQAMTNGTACLCGNYLPNEAYKVSDSKCKQECPGFSTETCGSRLGDFYSVYITGLEDNPDEDPAPSSSTSSSSTSTSAGEETSLVVVTEAAAITSSSASSSSTSGSGSAVNKAGAAAGAVVGVVAAIAVGVGIWMVLRKRRREKVEEEYRRSAAAREYAKKPEQDHRLEPVMLQRRDSVGSIADNQDYSRRILKVTNPDG